MSLVELLEVISKLLTPVAVIIAAWIGGIQVAEKKKRDARDKQQADYFKDQGQLEFFRDKVLMDMGALCCMLAKKVSDGVVDADLDRVLDGMQSSIKNLDDEQRRIRIRYVGELSRNG